MSRERLLSSYVSLVGHMTDYVASLTDGSVLALLELDGLPWQTLDEIDIRSRHRRWNSTLLNIAVDGLIFHVIQCRGLADPSVYPQGSFRSAFAEALDMTYRERLLDRSLYRNRTLLAVQLGRDNIAGQWIGEQFAKLRRRKAEIEVPEQRVMRLAAIVEILLADLAAYKPRRLGIVERNGRLFSEIAEALTFALTGVHRQVGLPCGPLSGMFSERVIVGSEAIEIRGPGYSAFAAGFGFRDYMAKTPPGVLDQFLASSYRCTVYQSFRVIRQADAVGKMSRKQHKMVSAGDKAASQIEELDAGMDDVQSRRVVMGEHCAVVLVFADELRSLNDIANAAWHDIADAGAVVAREDRALEAAYFSVIPGNAHLWPRPGVISSRNFTALAPLHAYPAGDAKGHWGGPIALFRTAGGTPYRFHLHVNGVGNTFVSGETGSGKSVWIAFLVAQAERAGAQVVLWDKDRGLDVLVRALGGRYLPLTNPTGLAPLKALTDSPEDITFLARLIRSLVASADGYTMSPEEDRRLHVALRAVMSLPVEYRGLSEVRAFLGAARDGAAVRLDKWCAGAELGWVVDNAEDVVRLDAPVIGFDQTDILDDSNARGPVMATLFHYTGKLVDGRRLMFVIDEFWRSLQEAAFADVVAGGLKTLRKQNAPVILATQSPRDALISPIAHTIREQCPTTVSFANPRAIREDYCEGGLGYTEPEFQIVRELQPAHGTFLVKQGTRSVVAQLPLAGMIDELAVLSGTARSVRLLDKARADVGDDPAAMLARFHEIRKSEAFA